jgi:HSP20 family molecular chaperone IbpA
MTTNQELTTKEKEVVSGERTHRERYYVPEVDIRETDDSLLLYADMPGVSTESIRVDLDNDVLRIAGDVAPRDYEGLTPLYTEYNVGNWVRRFTLTDTHRLAGDKVSARLTNGVLEVRLPKAAREKARRIQVS